MKRIFVIIILIYIIATFTSLAFASPGDPSLITEQTLTKLSNQFSVLEASWGRFRLGGDFSLTPYTNFNQSTTPVMAYTQDIDLFLDAAIDPNLQFSLKLANQRGWGTEYQYVGTLSSNPLQIDEAYLRMQYPKTFNYLGRFRFSLGAFGIISDFYTNPIEGFAFQHAVGNYQLIALYNRVNTTYNPATNQPESGTDYLAGRIGWSKQSSVVGLNIVPKGLGGEHDFSIDWSTGSDTYKMAAEFGWYSFQSTEYPDLNIGLVPGILASYGRNLSHGGFIQLKAGYFSSGFRPSYSSLAYVSGDDREWFQPNTQGIEVFLHNQLSLVYQLENRLILLTPVDSTQASSAGYRLHSTITKNITPVNQIQLGVDLKNISGIFTSQIFAGWMLRF